VVESEKFPIVIIINNNCEKQKKNKENPDFYIVSVFDKISSISLNIHSTFQLEDLKNVSE
jgi:hypothetical protein